MNAGKKLIITVFMLIAVILGTCMVFINSDSTGVFHLFKSESFHYQALRTLGHSMYQGAAAGEVFYVISSIRDQEEERWFAEWHRMAEKCERWARDARDNVSRGNAYLRASNYYRASEFFLYPGDKRKAPVYDQSAAAFQNALQELRIEHTIYYIPYENGKMRTYHFKGDADKPIIIVCGGYDSTNEESYFWVGAPLIARGYSVVMFEGPGQSSMIRHYKIKFTPDWHKPVGKVIDYLMAKDSSIANRKKILFGISLGGLLMGRAAAYEDRIDGAVLFGAPFDFLDGALYQLPSFARKLYNAEYRCVINLLANIKSRININTRWGLNNGLSSVGGTTAYEFLERCKEFTLKNVHDKVRCPVLVLYGERDWYISDGIQDVMFRSAFKNSKSYTLKTFPHADGSAEHCQVGAIEQAAMVITKWMEEQGFVKQ